MFCRVEVSNKLVDLILQLLDISELIAAMVLELHIVGHGLVIIIIDENTVLFLVGVLLPFLLLKVYLLSPFLGQLLRLLSVLSEINPVNWRLGLFLFITLWLLILFFNFLLFDLVFHEYILQFLLDVLLLFEEA